MSPETPNGKVLWMEIHGRKTAVTFTAAEARWLASQLRSASGLDAVAQLDREISLLQQENHPHRRPPTGVASSAS